MSPMDAAWAILKADFYSDKQRALEQALGPVYGHVRMARGKAQEEAERMPYSTDPKVRATQGPLDYLFAGMDIEPELMRPPSPWPNPPTYAAPPPADPEFMARIKADEQETQQRKTEREERKR